jgi:hypothetical protein
MFCMLLFNCVNYVFLLLCLYILIMYVLCHCVVLCTLLPPPGVNPIAVNISINKIHSISINKFGLSHRAKDTD